MRLLLSGVALFLCSLAVSATGGADDAPPEIPLWPNGAPGFEKRKDDKAALFIMGVAP